MPDVRTEAPPRTGTIRTSLVGVLVGALFVVYPFLVYVALTQWGARSTAGLVLGSLALWGFRARRFGQQGFRSLMLQVGGIALLSLGTLVSGSPAFLQQMPVLISALLLVTFVASLVRPPPMIERYARMITPDLSEGEIRHCRAVTWVWIVFLVGNAAIAEALVLWGSVEAWALYAGGIAYVLMGLLFAGEYLVRKARFGRFGGAWHDRVLARLLGRWSPPGGNP
jgi:uncharacterized membrane protein